MISMLLFVWHTARVRVWMKCFTLLSSSGWFLTRSRYFAISSMRIRVGCFWRSFVIVCLSGRPSGVSDSWASWVSPS